MAWREKVQGRKQKLQQGREHQEMIQLQRKDDSISSDDMPLNLVSKYLNPNSYESLCEPSLNHCELCDGLFKNKYETIVHNATHIIIPLIKQRLIKCKECLFYFSSNTEYQQHMRNHVINERSSMNKKQSISSRITFEDDIILNNSENLLKDLNSKVNVTLDILPINRLMKNKLEITNDFKIINVKEGNRFEVKNNEVNKSEGKKYAEKENNFEVKNYIEEDNNSDDCPLINNKYILDKKNSVNTFVNGIEFVDTSQEYDKVIYESVHFDELNKPNTVACKYCGHNYPNKYTLILHQTSHINFNRRLPPFCGICDWYIAGDRKNLKRHKKTHPLNTRKKIMNIQKCLQCGLSYRRYLTHINNYHSNSDVKYMKITRVCDLCYRFLKSSKTRSYTKIRAISKMGKRYQCKNCLRNFFELYEVQKTEFIQNRLGTGPMSRKLGKITNDQRLRNIQTRLKKISDMNKF